MRDTSPNSAQHTQPPAPGVMPDLAQRRRMARRVAWGIAALAALLYLIGFFVQGG